MKERRPDFSFFNDNTPPKTSWLRKFFRKKVLFFLFLFSVAVLFTPQLILIVRFNKNIYHEAHHVPPHEYGIVFGARVNSDSTLSEIARERVDAAVLLYKQGIITRLFISGDNHHNREAETMARYAEKKGVASVHIVIDRLGIDTHDTCRNFARMAHKGILFTQAFHLPRAMHFCMHEGIQPIGLAVNKISPVLKQANAFSIYTTRTLRHTREAIWTWAFLTGLYDRFSNEAEQLENSKAP